MGKFSYSPNNITTEKFGDIEYDVNVGNFTSISTNCTILLGQGHHDYETGTNFSFHYFHSNLFSKSEYVCPRKSGNVNIGSDVWIGHNVTIMPKITIGDGAVIATNSLITKDVEPYAIYGGNPAKLIKYRFTQEIIDKFLELKWWNLNDCYINEILPLLQQKPNMSMFEQIQKNIKQTENVSDYDYRKLKFYNLYRKIKGKRPQDSEMEKYLKLQNFYGVSLNEIEKMLIESLQN